MIDTLRFDGDEGFSLVELLVVIVVLGVVGGIVMTGIINGLRTTNRAQDRIDALTELEKGVERIGRELRAACQVERFEPDDVSVNVIRDGQVHRYRYVLGSELGGGNPPDVLFEIHSLYDASTDTFDVQSTNRFIGDVDNATLFTYLRPDRTPVGDAATDISTVRMTLRRALDQQDPVEVRTAVHLRNHGGFSCAT